MVLFYNADGDEVVGAASAFAQGGFDVKVDYTVEDSPNLLQVPVRELQGRKATGHGWSYFNRVAQPAIELYRRMCDEQRNKYNTSSKKSNSTQPSSSRTK